MKWFEREFPTELPRTLLPGIIERLRGTPARLEARLLEVAPEILTRRDGGAWSIQEQVGHLLDLEKLWLARVVDLFRERSDLTPADLTNRATHEAGYNRREFGSILEMFRQEREQLVAALESATPAQQEHAAVHPRLGTPMRVVDLAYFVAEHDDHHLATITRQLKRVVPDRASGQGDGSD